MRVKVCGMRDKANIEQVLALEPDFIGFIFYDKSPRYIGEGLDEEFIRSIPQNIKKVGVFVNSLPNYILSMVKKYDLQYVQLHGNELPDFCRVIRQKGVSVIKAFQVDETFNFGFLTNYKPHCDLFLFDTKGAQPGGNGVAFDWKLLQKYDKEKPFILSGGIHPGNLEDIVEMTKTLPVYAIDINSKFEISPGQKDVKKVEEFIQLMKKIKEEREIEV